MEITINDKPIEIKFGMAFIRELNKKVGLWTQNVNIGMALNKTLPALLGGDPEAMADLLYCGTAHIKAGRPKQSDIDTYMENVEDFDKLSSDLLDALKESTLTKVPLKKMMAQMK